MSQNISIKKAFILNNNVKGSCDMMMPNIQIKCHHKKIYIKIENFYFELYHFFSTFPSLCFFNQINDFYFFKSYRSNLLMSVYVSKRLTCHIYVITSSNKSPYRNHKLHSMDKTEQYHLITGAVSSLLEKTGVMKELLTYARK